MKITKRRLRKLIREAAVPNVFSIPVVVSWSRFLANNPEHYEFLQGLWDQMIHGGLSRDDVVEQAKAEVGYSETAIPERGSDTERKMRLVGGVSFHARQIQPGVGSDGYPSSLEIEQRMSQRTVAPTTSQRQPRPKYGPGGTHERWN